MQYAYKIRTVVVFGSYLTALPKIGDIDVALEVVPVRQNKVDQEDIEKAAQVRSPASQGFIQSLFWPKKEVLRAVVSSTFIETLQLSELEAMFKQGMSPKTKVVLGQWIEPSRVGALP